ncbi:S-adenosyl-L-methionine-dependent methyltransferase [Apiospora saccharicola]
MDATAAMQYEAAAADQTMNAFSPAFVDEELMREPTGSSIYEPDHVVGESGRRYHGYKEGSYLLPNDEAEQDRLDFQHAMMTLILGGKLAMAPIVATPKKVMDVATGTGIWALEFARANPGSYVVGTDLSKIQPEPEVPNCHFEKDDCEEDWLWDPNFDYIHIRQIVTGIRDPKRLFQQAYDNLLPGGWIEIQDGTMELDGEGVEDSHIRKWFDYCAAGATAKGFDVRKAKNYRSWLKDIGCRFPPSFSIPVFLIFLNCTGQGVLKLTKNSVTEIQAHRFEVPCSPWPKDPQAARIGAYQQQNMHDGLRGVSYLLLRNAGMSPEEIEEFVRATKVELREGKVKGYSYFYVVYGRKPL